MVYPGRWHIRYDAFSIDFPGGKLARQDLLDSREPQPLWQLAKQRFGFANRHVFKKAEHRLGRSQLVQPAQDSRNHVARKIVQR